MTINFRSMHHSFDITLAAKYGVIEAILIHHFQHWIQLNKIRGKNFIEGRTWTYQTLDDIAARFPYLNKKQVEECIFRLCNGNNIKRAKAQLPKMFEPVLVKGNFNNSKFDRTVWYAFSDENMFLPDMNPSMENTQKNDPSPISGNPEMETWKSGHLYQILETNAEKENNPPQTPERPVKKAKSSSTPDGAGRISSADTGEKMLCDYLLRKMLEKKPDFTGTITKNWLTSAKWLLKRRTPDQIRKLIDWALDHVFWGNVVHSPEGLKNNITSMELQMTQKKPEQHSSEKNREVASTLPNHPDIVVCSDHVGFKHGPMKYIPVNYDDREFAVKLKNELTLLGINL